MGLYEIHIDMTKCKNRILIIRGDNGSGKSTLSKAMNLFPDSNDSFIPGMPARKEIVLIDGNTFYKLSFIHGIKANGERDTTKAYITKTFDNQAVELNENGNVSSYKDILYAELGLDANFSALSQLSNDDRGLADKKPAERKRFVNSIISSLDTYNNIYKTLVKISSNYKSMINAISAKLSILGDEKSLTNNLEALEVKINSIQDEKDKAVTELAKAQSMISILDPDGSIQANNNSIISELQITEAEEAKVQAIIDGLLSSMPMQASSLDKDYKSVVNEKNSLIIQNQIAKKEIESLLIQKEKEAEELNQKIQKLSALQSSHNYELLKAKASEYKEELDSISQTLNAVGINDVMKLSKEEYILALESLRDLEEYISQFKASTDFSTIDSIVDEYIRTGRIPKVKDRSAAIANIDNMNARLKEYSEEKVILTSKIGILDRLALRPEACTIDTCQFIQEAVEFSKTNPNQRIDYLDAAINTIREDINVGQDAVKDIDLYNDALNWFATIVREVNKNGAILSKMPNGEMFNNKIEFFRRIISGYSFDYMKSIYQYIDLANLFDTYRQTMSIYEDYMNELKAYDGKIEIINALTDDIENINKAINIIVDKIEPITQEIHEREIKITRLQELEGAYDAVFDQMSKQRPLKDKIQDLRNRLLENNRKMNEIKAALSNISIAQESIAQYTHALGPLMEERDKAIHSVQMMKDYIKERDELQSNYDFIETIKYYSSPTTGIQLVFMELYMGKIIALANELLALLFKGQFVIQPFVINDTEFRIPCLGGGYLNDDISSMSSSQIGMISMILSFALLHHSSTKYNIIKLDEIDGPLDYNNRVYFMDVLNSIMDIMQTEQCIMISHNSELQIDNSDVILLKHDENMDYNRGNIIWRYQ